MDPDKQEEAKRLAQMFHILFRAKKEDPLFLKRVFVSHYCNIPYHVLLDNKVYPTTLIEELFAASFHLIRSFELAPWATDNLDERVENEVKKQWPGII